MSSFFKNYKSQSNIGKNTCIYCSCMINLQCKRKRNHIALRIICESKCFSGSSPRIQLLRKGQGGELKAWMVARKVFCPIRKYKGEEIMGKKDKTEKLFVACTDVFAELVNVLVYQGEMVLAEEAVLPGSTESIYESQEGKLNNQFRDCSMYAMHRGKVQALYNLENQSSVDERMPLRCAGYDGAAYRNQYKPKEGQGIYPVISLVLNWGEKPWRAAKSIRELIVCPVPEAAEEYLDRKQIHVFDMRFLSKEVRERFEGDVRVVLDYLSDRESMVRRNQKLRNPEEVMRMLHALTGDIRYLENIEFMEENGGRNMCDLLDAAENRGLQKGLQKGLIQGLITTCKELGISFDETAVKLKEKYSMKDTEVQKNMKLYW